MDTVVELLLRYSYLILFLGVVLEGEIFPLAAGLVVSFGAMNFPLTVAVTFLGSFLGDMLWFWGGWYGGHWLVGWLGRHLKPVGRRVVWLQEHFQRRGERTLWLTKFIYSFGHSSIVVAGAARMPVVSFVRVDLPASLVWALLFTALGYFFGSSFTLLHYLFWYALLAAVIVVTTVVLTNIFLRRRLEREV